jgi:hypothetical protein
MTDPEYTPTADEAALIASIEHMSQEKKLQVASFIEVVAEAAALLESLGDRPNSDELDRLIADLLVAGVKYIKDAPEFQG